MRVVHAAPGYPPSTGGVETHLRKVATRLVDRGHEVTVVTGDARRVDARRRERREGVQVVRCYGVAPGRAFHFAPGVARAVRRTDADVVHVHNYHALVLPFAALGAGDRPFVVTPHYHGGSASSVRDRLLSLYRPVGEMVLRRADAVVAVSEWERDQLQTDFGIDAQVIRNGVDVERFAGTTPRERDRPYLLTVGRLEKYKGVQHAIRALAELPEYDLLVAGTGPYREELERVARETGVVDRVEFLGYVDDDALPSLYVGADLYLALSSLEAYGLTVGEALTAGTPCIVRETGALTDWSRSTGVVGIGEVAPVTIADAVVRARTLSVATDLQTWRDVVDDLLSSYEAVAGMGQAVGTRSIE